jgi:hypothetical protein
MIVERNDESTTEKKNTIICNKLWNNTSVKMNSGWSWTLKLIIGKIEWINVETKFHKKYDKQLLTTLMNTTRSQYVSDDRKKKFQDYRCKDANSDRMMGIF